MIISEKQIIQLLETLREAIDDELTDYGIQEARKLRETIIQQQSEELKVIE